MVGGGGLHSDGRFLHIAETANLLCLRGVDHQARSGRHVGIGPGQYLLPGWGDGDAADNAVIAAVLHLLKNDFPLRVHEYRAQVQMPGDLVHQIDLETDPLACGNVLERRVDEVGANAQNPGLQRLHFCLGIGQSEHRGEQQGGDPTGSPSHA